MTEDHQILTSSGFTNFVSRSDFFDESSQSRSVIVSFVYFIFQNAHLVVDQSRRDFRNTSCPRDNSTLMATMRDSYWKRESPSAWKRVGVIVFNPAQNKHRVNTQVGFSRSLIPVIFIYGLWCRRLKQRTTAPNRFGWVFGNDHMHLYSVAWVSVLKREWKKITYTDWLWIVCSKF